MIQYTVSPIAEPSLMLLFYLVVASMSFLLAATAAIAYRKVKYWVVQSIVFILCMYNLFVSPPEKIIPKYTKVVAERVDYDSSTMRSGKRSVPTGVIFYNTPDGVVSFNTGSGVPWPQRAVLYRYEK